MNMLPPPCFLGGGGARAGGGGARVGAGAGFAPPPNKLSKGFAGFAGGGRRRRRVDPAHRAMPGTTVRRGCRAGANAVAVATMSASRMVLPGACAEDHRYSPSFQRRVAARTKVALQQQGEQTQPRDHVASHLAADG